MIKFVATKREGKKRVAIAVAEYPDGAMVCIASAENFLSKLLDIPRHHLDVSWWDSVSSQKNFVQPPECPVFRFEDAKERAANAELEAYEFGQSVTVSGQDAWDRNDPLDWIKVLYVEDSEGGATQESERVSFHVKFDKVENFAVTQAYALLVENGGELGVRGWTIDRRKEAEALSEVWGA